MTNKALLKIVNPVVMILVLNQMATGLVPKLYGPGTFRLMHKQMALLLSVALAAHLALNFSWVKKTYWKSGAKKTR